MIDVDAHYMALRVQIGIQPIGNFANFYTRTCAQLDIQAVSLA